MNEPHELHAPEGVPDAYWTKLARRDGSRWAIDERNAAGEVIGTAYRNADGSKDTKPGSKRGLILAWPLANYAGTSADDPVFVCEGASDTAAVMSLGLHAVGVPMAGHCAPMLAELLAGRYSVLVADADNAGRKGAAKIAAAMHEATASVRIIEPPEGAKDARAAVIAGADQANFIALAKAAALWKPTHATGNATPTGAGGNVPVIVCMADVQPVPVSWLWPGRIARGRITVLCGRPGEGKSFATMDWAARVTTGRAWPDGAPCEAGSVLLVAGEDDPADTIRPRLDAHGGDANRVRMLCGVSRVGKGGQRVEAAFTLADMPELEATLATMPDCKLLIIDPIGSFMGGKVDAHRDNEVRAVLAPLAALAQRTGVAVLLVAHQRKGAATHADDLVMGSRAFTGIARSVIHLLADPDDDKRRLLLAGKNNLAEPAPGLAFTFTGTPARIEWERDPVKTTAADVLVAQATSGERRSKRRDAAEWIAEYLAAGPRPAADVERDALAAGIAKSTLNRAKTDAGVEPIKSGFDGGWMWQLPQGCQAGREDSQSG
ncbi:MAG TPA: AAA family ATPase [Phycisphaerales bacterium]|nr:AAA family ATPase [Phycisphaerales bacterium]